MSPWMIVSFNKELLVLFLSRRWRKGCTCSDTNSFILAYQKPFSLSEGLLQDTLNTARQSQGWLKKKKTAVFFACRAIVLTDYNICNFSVF